MVWRCYRSTAIKGTTIKAQPVYRQLCNITKELVIFILRWTQLPRFLMVSLMAGKGNSDESGWKPYIESKEIPANGDRQLHAVHPSSGDQLIEYKTNHG
ncbi:hypothetical protein QYF36_023144 [Acer negundo]|nr:hypothetical protein QYF36_023144 [Acer negundo]